tara:strand:+ start:193 stop:552 length:360 start_codon:yes stop_codon:yes gene_type:complete
MTTSCYVLVKIHYNNNQPRIHRNPSLPLNPIISEQIFPPHISPSPLTSREIFPNMNFQIVGVYTSSERAYAQIAQITSLNEQFQLHRYRVYGPYRLDNPSNPLNSYPLNFHHLGHGTIH